MTILPATYNFVVYRNGDVRQDVTIKVDGLILDLTGWSAQMEVRPSVTDNNTPIININDAVPTAAGSQIFLTGQTLATALLTSSANYADGETVTIGSRVYTFQSALTAVDGHVLVGGSEVASLANLHHAINASGGVPGTDYFVTAADPNVTATDDGVHVVTVSAKPSLTAAQAEAVATQETSTTASWGGITLAGAVDSGLQIFIDEVDMATDFPLAPGKTGLLVYVYDLLLTAPSGGDVGPYLAGTFTVHNGVTR